MRAVGLRGLPRAAGISPFTTLWRALGGYFRDPRLRQLFGRYATYCGSSPFLAPATLMLVAHVEQEGVWVIDGGMHQLAQALAGSRDRTRRADSASSSEVREVTIAGGRASGVTLGLTARRIAADACDRQRRCRRARQPACSAPPPRAPHCRCRLNEQFAVGRHLEPGARAPRGFPLSRHNVVLLARLRRRIRRHFQQGRGAGRTRPSMSARRTAPTTKPTLLRDDAERTAGADQRACGRRSLSIRSRAGRTLCRSAHSPCCNAAA
ncbi:MAG: hypothetical protein MZV49_22685 [Rhodopseudomonas palustris]|nr:hypothetical protein [Rhodopseudomonas palustris]